MPNPPKVISTVCPVFGPIKLITAGGGGLAVQTRLAAAELGMEYKPSVSLQCCGVGLPTMGPSGGHWAAS